LQPAEINDENARILVVGRDYGREESRAGRPFVGPSGQLLNQCLVQAGLTRAEVNVSNVVNEQPPGNKFGAHRTGVVDAGVRSAIDLVRSLRPNLVVALGNEASFMLVVGWPSRGESIFTASGIEDRRGYIWRGRDEFGGVKVLTTIHPAAALRQWVPWTTLLTRDLGRAKDESISSKISRPIRRVRIISSHADAERHVKALLDYPKLSFDIEIDGEQRLLCVGFAGRSGDAVVFPASYLDEIRYLLERPWPRKLAANGQFDIHFLRTRCNIRVKGYRDDTQVAWHACYPQLAGKQDGSSAQTTKKSVAFLASLFTTDAWWKCLDADSLVLMADFSTKPLRFVNVGDEVWAFDEQAPNERKRTWKTAKVTAHQMDRKQCLIVSTDQGSLVGTPDHRVLARDSGNRWRWRRLDELRKNWKLKFTFEPWPFRCSDEGYIEGFFDGEGTVRKSKTRNTGIAISASQKPGPTLDWAKQIIEEHHGLPVSIHRNKTSAVQGLYIREGTLGAIRFCNHFQGIRIPNNLRRAMEECPPQFRCKHATIQSIEDFGEREVADITTTTGTFIADGFAVHNCYDTDEMGMYELCGRDCCIEFDIMEQLDELLGTLDVFPIYGRAMSLVNACVDVQERGILVDEPLRKKRLDQLQGRADDIVGEVNELVQPLLEENRDHERFKLFESTWTCPCCRNGKGKRNLCWSCSGFDSSPNKRSLEERFGNVFSGTKQELIEKYLTACERCNGEGQRTSVVFNPKSHEQVKILLYEFLKLPPRYSEGKLSGTTEKIRGLLANV